MPVFYIAIALAYLAISIVAFRNRRRLEFTHNAIVGCLYVALAISV